MNDTIQLRIQHATESILENEALTEDLDDTAANMLIEWGVSLAQQIVSQTIELDETQAEEAIYQPMRALRKMLRTANQWAINPDESGLGKILEQALIVYGIGYAPPSLEEQSTFLTQIPANLAERLTALQKFVERDKHDSINRINPTEEPVP